MLTSALYTVTPLQIMDTSSEVAWTDIAGLEFAKKTLKEIIILPMLRP